MSNTLSIESLRNQHREKFHKCRTSIIQSGVSLRYFYNSLAIEEAWNRFKDYKIPAHDQEYESNPYYYQYDLELYIFLHWDELLKREYILRSGYKEEEKIKILEHGLTGFPRERHLANACTIRWPARYAPDGSYLGDLAITPWLMDYFYGISNYKNVVEFGGAGQGKTYGPLAFMCLIYDFFLFTKHGAQCSFSTTGEYKLNSSTWPYLNQLYGIPQRHQFSLSAGRAIKCADWTYSRTNAKGKRLDEGGTIRGVLLQKGRSDSSVVDKLTGCHSPIARIYLLDEAQSTDDAPLSAYTNMFLHPKWGWFNMSGNYDLDTDLLGINTEPNTGWDAVNDKTHMWEGTLKRKTESLYQKSLVIHFNNELSPGITDIEFGRKYKRFVPTIEKREKLYPTDDSKKTLLYKRMWVGFKYEKNLDEKRCILTSDLIEDTKCHENLPDDFVEFFSMGSFDSAPASIDRNINTTFGIGMCNDGLPMFYAKQIELYPKPTKAMEYYQQTCDRIIRTNTRHGIEKGHQIMDWTARPAHIEMLAKMGWPCHHLIYSESIPKELGRNKITGAIEDKIQLEMIESFTSSKFITNVKYYAHEMVANKITLGAYIFRLFVEHGRVRGLNSSILTGLNSATFEKEFLTRQFYKKVKKGSGEILFLDSKEEFKGNYGFSPDILDTFFQFCYMIYVIYRIRPDKRGLGLLKRKDAVKRKNKQASIWKNKLALNV